MKSRKIFKFDIHPEFTKIKECVHKMCAHVKVIHGGVGQVKWIK